MAKIYPLGNFAGLKLLARPSAFIGFFLIWLSVATFAGLLVGYSIEQALAAGLVCAALHYASELLHNLGHAWAAHRSKYPMEGVLFWGVLATSLYPANEKDPPARVHIQRALGGPLASLLVSLLTGIQLAVISPLGDRFPSMLSFTATFAFWDNLLIFTIGALLPLGFTDGSTLLKWWPK